MCVYQCILPGECSFTDVDWHHCEGSDPPRTSLKSRIAPQNCCTNNNQWKMLIQRCIRSTKVTAHEIGWTPTRNFGTIWFIRSLYWFFGPIRFASPAPHLIMDYNVFMVSLKGQRELYTSIFVVLFYQVAWVHQEVTALFYCPYLLAARIPGSLNTGGFLDYAWSSTPGPALHQCFWVILAPDSRGVKLCWFLSG